VTRRGWLSRRRGVLARRCLFILAVSLIVGSPLPARATLANDVSELKSHWALTGRVEELRPRLLGRGERLPLVLPEWSTRAEQQGCTSLVVLGSPSVSFALHLREDDGAEPEPSQVGWAQLVRCGDARAELELVWLEMRSPRGVLQAVVAGAAAPLPTPGALLGHRDPGPLSESGEAGTVPLLASLDSRASAWESQAKRDGAVQIEHQMLRATNGQIAGARLELPTGCHRLSALSVQTVRTALPRDVDLFVRGETFPVLGRQDQTENADAEVEFCLGKPTPVRLAVMGLMPGDRSMLQHASFPLPDGLPERWGTEPRARLAEAFFRRGFRGQLRGPVDEALGVAGRTTLPLSLEQETCYVAGVSVIQGSVKALAVEVSLPDVEGARDGTSTESAIALAFCASESVEAALRVEAIGPSVAWFAVLFRIGRDTVREGPP
jgi:hypothetical protein